MTLKYLMDENVNPAYATQIRRREPDFVIRVIGEPDTPPRGTLDPEILLYCEETGLILVTNNLSTLLLNSFKSHIPHPQLAQSVFW